MNLQVDPSSNLASALLDSKIRPPAVVGYRVKIFCPSPLNYVTRSPGFGWILAWHHVECHRRVTFLLAYCKSFGEGSYIAGREHTNLGDSALFGYILCAFWQFCAGLCTPILYLSRLGKVHVEKHIIARRMFELA